MPFYLYTRILHNEEIRCQVDRDNGDGNNGSAEVDFDVESLRERLHLGNFPYCFGADLPYTVEHFSCNPIFNGLGIPMEMQVNLILRVESTCVVYLIGRLSVTQHSADGILEPEEDYFGLEGPAITSILIDGNLCLMEYAGNHPFRDEF